MDKQTVKQKETSTSIGKYNQVTTRKHNTIDYYLSQIWINYDKLLYLYSK